MGLFASLFTRRKTFPENLRLRKELTTALLQGKISEELIDALIDINDKLAIDLIKCIRFERTAQETNALIQLMHRVKNELENIAAILKSNETLSEKVIRSIAILLKETNVALERWFSSYEKMYPRDQKPQHPASEKLSEIKSQTVLKTSNDSLAIRTALETLIALKSTNSVPLIEKLLSCTDTEIVRHAMRALWLLNSTRSIPLIQLKLKDHYYHIRCDAIIALWRLGSSSSAPLILPLLEDEVELVREEAIFFLWQFKVQEAIPAIEKLLNDKSDKVRLMAKSALSSTGDIRLHPLYVDQRKEEGFFDSSKRLVRRELQKTGSRLIVLGGAQVGKTAIRIMSEEAFVSWKKAFEMEEEWRKAGYDYIPVEPILKKRGKYMAYKQEDGKYRVYTKVLGPTLFSFIEDPANAAYATKLNLQQDQIGRILSHNGIRHGHLHNLNFCVSIEEGAPRIYAIDFDQAKSPDQGGFYTRF